MVQTRFIRLIPLFFALAAVGIACEPDLQEVNRIANIEAEKPVDISKGVTIIFSDSAIVKAKIVADEMHQYREVEKPYFEFPKGITIFFYGPDGEETQNITSEYAVRYEFEERVVFRNNVVITRSDGIRIETEELIHDEKQNIFFNTVPISGYSADGKNTFQGASFTADGSLKNIEIQNTTGSVYVDGDKVPIR